MQVIELDGGRDYRLDRMGELNVYITPLGPDADAAMDAALAAFDRCEARRADDDDGFCSASCPCRRPPMAWRGSRFDQLCREPLGAADYLALAKAFHTILIDRVPQFRPEDLNAARRFTLLIDTLYDERVKLVCSAATPPADLCNDCEDAEWFKRTASRLIEMQSAHYLRTGHGTHELMSVN
jgi:cell division protein ZapE